MKLRGRLIPGVFKTRINRFTALITIDGKENTCFLPNPGRMKELLNPMAKVILRHVNGEHRKTSFDLIAVVKDRKILSIDCRVPNKLIFESLKKGKIMEFTKYTHIKPEPTYGHSRFDFLLSNESEKCFLEVKSCTLVKNRVALFPDAPTLRGRRHLLDLEKARVQGYRACMLFLVQRIDVDVFTPNDKTAPTFGHVLRKVAAKGVEVLAYSSTIVEREYLLGRRLKINLDTLATH